MEEKSWYLKLIKWRERKIPQKRFVLYLSFFVGIFASTAAYFLKSAIHLVHHLVTSAFNPNEVNFLFLILPFVGITLTYLFVKYIVKDDISHGVTRILYAISQRKSIIKLHNTWTSIVGSAVTIGFGGSVGAESPIVLTGSAIGSNLGKFFKLDQRTLMLLIGCGAAGAIGGIFKAPIAGLVFTLEVLMLDMTLTSIVPLLISSVTATTFSYFLTGSSFMFQFTSYEPFSVSGIPQLILLGIVCGFVALYVTRGMNFLENFFKNIKSPTAKLLLGGITLGVLIFFFPPLYGEGYNTIGSLLNGDLLSVLNNSLIFGFANNFWIVLVYLMLIVIFKIVASTATTSPGGVGGLFAPSLFIGSITGYALSILLIHFNISAPTSNFALAGMSGVMSGVMHAPLTGVFLIAELTGSYNLFLSLMIVSTVSYVTIMIFERHSIYSMRLAQKGELITHHKDRAVLTLLKMEDVIETDLKILSPSMLLGELVKVISNTKRNIFPIVDDGSGELLGVLSLDEVRNIMFRPELYSKFTVQKLMISPPAILNVAMSMETVMQIFEDTGAWNLPVVNEEKVYLGFVSKSKIFNSYREVLVEFYQD